ncbi:MAG: type II secretion system protein [Planctomycetota bacterium]|jgi:prepilin-type N-terminal cleavage/methylation domain-containing protein/prepilin-type processing-associated H-X9-DG protein
MIWSPSSSTGAERGADRRRRGPAGFSLVELLVALGVVALLIGLLVPALAGVRRAGRATACQSNLRQMALAAQHYANLNDAWPLAIDYQQRDGRLVQAAWDWVTGFGDDELIEPGPLWAHAGDPDHVMQCPEYHGRTSFGGDPFTGYNYNTTFVGGEEAFAVDGQGPVRPGVRPHACRRAASAALFGDGGTRGSTNKFMRAPLYHESTAGFNIGLGAIYSGGQSFRHAGTTSVAYLDGHVAAVHDPRRGELATAELLETFLGYPDNGFLSDDNDAYDPR